ncbi:MAG: hypothetical protein A3I77_02755 [Gammaproteobacteria bacterium RIFCSPLOWO2_02_FULL_42_14]|nr:MAG: hypothetical protein A3B71_08060 [Gammaproteobacteria bacterium RIFCSPHIGHO2_02_FULL_42_43]OGT27422.1 MAG: hypothetical protein A2624_06780 [Gammaproteobacteria bacterium RIFCSPHIGHO2_01_FULL_42_8]OGT52369.1 MAG: hypothetical protein A3E54_01935 [Gammaproteobacteria bacterium RIFCSPHIGHO2_12_FULL_41_25]OGT63340.1 MAG: hypothetical protein A3I77_02755 [Gammaproteobacteria bacterium RIFCSPLOWO2_02_FULL_42_14]OGT86308.1 MAG: hypothetical protein A3G86_07220 [Gammaproteobacteria bacterium R
MSREAKCAACAAVCYFIASGIDFYYGWYLRNSKDPNYKAAWLWYGAGGVFAVAGLLQVYSAVIAYKTDNLYALVNNTQQQSVTDDNAHHNDLEESGEVRQPLTTIITNA